MHSVLLNSTKYFKHLNLIVSTILLRLKTVIQKFLMVNFSCGRSIVHSLYKISFILKEVMTMDNNDERYCNSNPVAINIKSLLRNFTQKGFSLDMLSTITNISKENLLELSSTENISSLAIPNNDFLYLHIFLTQLLCVSPRDNHYLISMVESLQTYFDIPNQAIANYIGISTENFQSALKDIDLLQYYYPEIMHLSMTLLRNKQFSLMKI